MNGESCEIKVQMNKAARNVQNAGNVQSEASERNEIESEGNR
jgi:hypothetical protein